ncbi:Calx-beta domain-containing protein [Maribacter sp. MJ134]|uniref:Calx-beta domain-containing protein n=1 Tax=Maribacter sp. MJ134 TaxID=2496865 RepID=UPI0013E0DAAD|nr:Calx-beta domain-containing protein [Maribacter sp. MJ134]
MNSNTNQPYMKDLFLPMLAKNNRISSRVLKVMLFLLLVASGNKLAAQTTYNDEFSVISYGNNDGTANFDTNWVENDANGGAENSGNIFIADNRLTFTSLQSTDALSRPVNLAAASSASISINYTSALRGNAELELQILQSNGTWRELLTIQTTATSGNRSSTFSGTGFLHSNTAFRFVPKAPDDWAAGETIHINHFRISTNISNNAADAEIKRPFVPRFSQNLKGDFTFIANTTIGTDPVVPYNGTDGNSTLTTQFIDIDSDGTTFNSSNAVLANPEGSIACLNYRKVFLYWAASNKEYSANTGDGGSEPIWDFDDVKLMLPGSSTYTTYTADEVIYNGRADHFENDPIVLFKDITADVDALASPYGTYQVANVKGAEGVLQSHSGSATGTSGGWQIVFVYESFDLPPKNVTLFDGYAHVTASENILDIDFDGFQTIPTGPVNADVMIGALEGDREITGDELQILDTSNNWVNLSTTQRPATNFFNSKITIDNTIVTNRTPNSTNTLGFDAAIFELDNTTNDKIANSQTSATMRITSTQESYGIYLLGLSVEVYEPNLGSFQLETASSTINVPPGSTLPLTLNFDNFGNDNIENLEVTLAFPDQLDFTSITNSPAGTTSSYDAPSRTLTIQVPDGISDVGDPAYVIDFNALVVNPCTNCSTNTGIQALATYDGQINPTSISTLSSGTLEDCGFGNNDMLQISIQPTISINDSSVTEGGDLVFTISSSHQFDTDQVFTLSYTDIETSASDYSGPASVTLFANSNTVTFSVNTTDDNILEGSETFQVNFSGSTGIITDDNGLGTITDNEVCSESNVIGGNITVNSTGDGGDVNPGDGNCADSNCECTLRAAIEEANALAGADSIHFNISGAGIQIISPNTVLPDITETLVIDGTTQPGFLDSPLIRIDGDLIGINDLLTFSANSDFSEIRNIILTRAVRGIVIEPGADNITIAGNWIGTDGTGDTSLGQNIDAILVQGAFTTIGGTNALDRNVIANSFVNGIFVDGPSSYSNNIIGNIVGLEPDGITPAGNTNPGVLLIGGGSNTVGGILAAQRNIIGSNFEGVDIYSDNNIVQGNYIGTDISGTLNRGMSRGVEISPSASNNLVGGTDPRAANLIAFNGNNISASFAPAGLNNSFLGNSIHSSTNLGIDLSGDQNDPDINDLGDTDTGSNDLLNYPVINSIVLNNGVFNITFDLDIDDTNVVNGYRIEFFASPVVGVSGYGEGQVYLGSMNVAGDVSNQAMNITPPNGVNSGWHLSATTTEILSGTTFGSTSEFALAVVLPFPEDCANGIDDDGDGLVDCDDPDCFLASNTGDTDSDGDGIGDSCDFDDPNNGISVADFTVNEDAGTADFVVTYTGPTVQDAFTVDFNVTDGSAIDPDDYTVATAGTNVAFPTNTTSGTTQVVTINIVDDALLEGAEDLNITLSNISDPLVAMVDDTGLGTITDNDAPGAGDGIAVSDFTVNEDAGTADFVVTYTGPTVQDAFTVDFNVTDGSAIDPDDYTVATAGTNVAFPTNTTSGTTQVVTINIVDDALLEGAEDLNITLSNISDPLVAMVDDTGLGTITDNDAPGAGEGIAVSDFTVNEDAGTADFVVTYTGPTVQDAFTVDFNVTDGSAIDPDDYTVATAGTNVTFPANTTTGTTQVVTINIVDDALLEGAEDLNITLSNISDPLVAMVDDTGLGTITDNDAPGAGDGIAVSDFTVNEDAGTADFVVTYTGPTVQDAFTVDFNVTDGSAIDPDDYTVATAGTNVAFPANTTSGTTQVVTINIVDDALLEGAEDLNITLSNISDPLVAMVDDTGLGTITDNDAPGAGEGIAVSDFTVNEDAGTADFVVTYTGPTVQDAFTVDFNVTDGSAIDPDDYTVATAGTNVAFPANTTSGTTQVVTINIVDDALLEGAEDLNITLSNISDPLVAMVDDTGLGTITDNDAPGAGDGIAVSDFTVNEDAGTADFVVTYTGPTVQDAFTVDFNVTDGSAIDPDDYTVATAGTNVAFPANTTSGTTQVVTINIVDDALLEGAEDLNITLSNISDPLVAMVDDTGLGTITDNDANGPTEGIAVSDFTVNEDAGTATFVISYTGNTVQNAFNVNFNVTDNSAIDPDDYTVANTDTFVTFPAGTATGDTQLVTINIVDDAILEANEDLNITLSNISNPLVAMVDDTGLGTITDNDANGPTEGIAVSDFTVNEDAGTATFVISYTGNTVQNAFNVNFNVTDNSAIDPDDYTVANTDTFVTFPAGTATGDTQLVTINIVDDTIIENTETMDIALTFDAVSPVGVNMLDDAGVGTITDNDANGPTEGIAVSDFTVNEDAGTATFVISYTGNTVQNAFNVNFNVTDNSAIDPDDYTVANTDTFVTFPAGTATGDTQLVTINIVDDTIIENTETMDIALTFDAVPPVGVNMLDDAGVGTITDNDAPGMNDGLYIDDLQVNEQTGVATVTVRVQGSFTAFNVDYATNDGGGTATATAGGVDYTASNGTLAFAEGQSSITFNVVIIDDCLIESTEVFFADLLNAPDFVPVIDGNATITIIDDEEALASSDFEAEITNLCGDETPEVPQLTFTGGSGDYEVLFSEEIQNASDSEDFMIIRTWNVTDTCDNTASFEQIIFVLQPQLQEITIDICVEDEPIDLLGYLPEGFDTNGVFEVTEGDVMLNGSMFVPEGLELGEYRIAYTSTGGECKYYADFTITTNSDCVPCGIDDIEVSKAVTANGDGVNDMFEIRGAEYCDYTFDVMIFNRWGNMVYEGKDYRNDWGGFAPNNSFGKSGFLPTGTYYYIINVNGADFKQLNGYIYLGAE